MATLSRTWRLLFIGWVLIRHGLDEAVFSIPLLRPFRFLLYLLPWNWFRAAHSEPHGVRVRQSLEQLGPIFVKFGQMLSTRRDLLPDDMALELARLQDRVPPFPGSEARLIVEQALGQSVGQLFREFDETPLASASIAQVHVATLWDGHEVVVKVVRPGIERTIRRDLDLMYVLADLVHRYWSEGPRLRPREIVAEYEKTVFDELDLVREGANASQLRRNFKGSKQLYIPEIYWELTRRNVMVMERIYGIPINAIDRLRAQGVDLKKLSTRGVEIFFTQVFTHNFFHADMHPGNIFVAYGHPHDPSYIAVDFGIVGTLTSADQRYIAENFVAFFNRDYQRVAELHLESGWVPQETRLNELESAIRSVCEPIFQRPLRDISFGHLLLRLFQTARRFNISVQPQLVLLQKTLLHIEGLGRELDPDLNLWETAKPFLEKWMSEQVGVRAIWKSVSRGLPFVVERLPEMPELLYQVLNQGAQGQLTAQWQSEQLESLREEIRAGQRRLVLSIAGAAAIAGAGLLAAQSGGGEFDLMVWILLSVGGVLLVAAWPRGSSNG